MNCFLSLAFQVANKGTRHHLIEGLYLSFNLLLLLLQSSALSRSDLRQADSLADRPDEIVSSAGSLGEENKTSNRGALAEEGCIMSTMVGCRAGGERRRRGGGEQEERKSDIAGR